jgi:hypothetical protein
VQSLESYLFVAGLYVPRGHGVTFMLPSGQKPPIGQSKGTEIPVVGQ